MYYYGCLEKVFRFVFAFLYLDDVFAITVLDVILSVRRMAQLI